jgi:phosphatidylinositol alpha-mannosyltransferase
MKIGFISPHPFTYPGGVQKHTLALKEHFEEEGNSIKLISPREEVPQKRDKDTILLGGAFYLPGGASKTNLSFQMTPLTIKRMLKKEAFDILHFQNFGLFLPIQVLEVADRLKRKGDISSLKILTLHAFWDDTGFKDFSFFIDFFNNSFLPKFDGVITVSRPVFNQIKYDGPIEVIPNGIDIEHFSPEGRKMKKFDDDKLNILFVGRIEKRKGVLHLIKVFSQLHKKYKNIRLIIVGEGNRRDKMESFVKKNKIPDIFFEGEVRDYELPKYYRTADICCFPAIFGEAFGIVLLEAMASGKPVVAFANEGYKEVLNGEGAKFLASPGDEAELAKKIELFINDEQLRNKMGHWGRQESKKYSWENVASQTLKFYNTVKRK